MVTSVEIDLNVRVRGRETYVGIEDVRGHSIVGDVVLVFESESKLVGLGRITEVDQASRLVYLAVDWANLREDPEAVAVILQPHPLYRLSDHQGIGRTGTAAGAAAMIDNWGRRVPELCR